jgi:exodeoxyribonuclease V alpha subunit
MATIEEALYKLKKSSFRSKFHLTVQDKAYIREKGIDTIRKHAKDFIQNRLAPSYICNDGKQTPMRGHPVFVAQHACACCCRGCLEKWYRIPKGTELSEIQQEKIINLLMAWIQKELVKDT